MRVSFGIVAGALVASLFALATPALAGAWKFQREARGHPELRYIEDGKTTFYIGCGHAFGLHLKYPGTPGENEKPASIAITSGKSSMTFNGQFSEPFEDMATTFLQWDLGYARQDPDLYGKKWDVVRNRLLDLLDTGQPLSISAGKDSYMLPPNNAKKWRKPFEDCG